MKISIQRCGKTIENPTPTTTTKLNTQRKNVKNLKIR